MPVKNDYKKWMDPKASDQSKGAGPTPKKAKETSNFHKSPSEVITLKDQKEE